MAKSEREKKFNEWKRNKEQLESYETLKSYALENKWGDPERYIKEDLRRYNKAIEKYTKICNELFTKEVEEEFNARKDFENKFKEFIEKNAKAVIARTGRPQDYESVYTACLNDLYVLNSRVVNYVGTIVELEEVAMSDKGLYGVVKGTDGTCRVYGVLAGGYNIQRLHVRMLVSRY